MVAFMVIEFVADVTGFPWHGPDDDATPWDDAPWCHASPRLGDAPSRLGDAPAYAITWDAP